MSNEVRKPFSRELHKANDPPARKVVKEYLKKQSIIVQDNPNQFGVDLLSVDGTLMIEVEHRLSWRGEEFPFEEVNIPRRKKYLGEGKIQYFILSYDYSHLGMINGDGVKPYIVDNNLHINKNRFVAEGEFFYKVPRSAFRWVKL
jgi:hypothetical protein